MAAIIATMAEAIAEGCATNCLFKKCIGYEEVERVTVLDPKKPEAPTYDDFYAMVRPAASRNK